MDENGQETNSGESGDSNIGDKIPQNVERPSRRNHLRLLRDKMQERLRHYKRVDVDSDGVVAAPRKYRRFDSMDDYRREKFEEKPETPKMEVVGTPAEGMDLDPRYLSIREELKQKWLEEHPGEDFLTEAGQNYNLGYMDPAEKHLPTIKSDTDKTFRERYSDDAQAYDEKEKTRIYDDIDEDPAIKRVKADILKNTNLNSQLKNARGGDNYRNEWGRINIMENIHGWRNFVRQYPEKASAYADKNADIKAALDEFDSLNAKQVEDASAENYGGDGVSDLTAQDDEIEKRREAYWDKYVELFPEDAQASATSSSGVAAALERRANREKEKSGESNSDVTNSANIETESASVLNLNETKSTPSLFFINQNTSTENPQYPNIDSTSENNVVNKDNISDSGAGIDEKEFRTGDAVWKNADHDTPVKVIGDLGLGPNGRRYVAIENSNAGVPFDEIEFTQEEVNSENDSSEQAVVNEKLSQVDEANNETEEDLDEPVHESETEKFALFRNEIAEKDRWGKDGKLDLKNGFISFSKRSITPKVPTYLVPHATEPRVSKEKNPEEWITQNSRYIDRGVQLAIDVDPQDYSGEIKKLPTPMLWSILEADPERISGKGPLGATHTFDSDEFTVHSTEKTLVGFKNTSGEVKDVDVGYYWKKLSVDRETLVEMQKKAIDYIEAQVVAGNMPADLLDTARGILKSHNAPEKYKYKHLLPFRKTQGNSEYDAPINEKSSGSIEVWKERSSLKQSGDAITYADRTMKGKGQSRIIEIATKLRPQDEEKLLTKQAWDILKTVPKGMVNESGFNLPPTAIVTDSLTESIQDKNGKWLRYVKPFTANSRTLIQMQDMIRSYVKRAVSNGEMDEDVLKTIDGIFKYKHGTLEPSRYRDKNLREVLYRIKKKFT